MIIKPINLGRRITCFLLPINAEKRTELQLFPKCLLMKRRKIMISSPPTFAETRSFQMKMNFIQKIPIKLIKIFQTFHR
jgi:hypothetical protein